MNDDAFQEVNKSLREEQLAKAWKRWSIFVYLGVGAIVVGVAVGLPSFVICVAIIVCNFKRRQKKATTIVKAIPTTTIKDPVAQASATSGVELISR